MPGVELLFGEDDDFCLLAHPDPVVLEINTLQNRLKEKGRELKKAQNEIRALRVTEVLKDKAVEELAGEVKRLEEKVRSCEDHLEQKRLDIKKLMDDKKEALAAQYAAEATLRRVYANQKDDDSVPIELVIAPLEAELKMHKNEVLALQEDKRALERHTKSKEAALLEAEGILKSALERALIVEEVQNQNVELRRQIEICLEENKILEKTSRQKILEVEKLSQTITELEEAILAGAAAANTICDYRRQISELNEEKRTLERELARAKISANRIASVVANEWKNEKDKVMPVRQWLEERRILQAEMQKLKDKLVISERAAKAEAQIKEKLKLRLKTLEEGLKDMPSLSFSTDSSCKKGRSNFFAILSSNTKVKRSLSQPRASTIVPDMKKRSSSGESLLKKGLWTSRNKVMDNNEKEYVEMNKDFVVNEKMGNSVEFQQLNNIKSMDEGRTVVDVADPGCDDTVSGSLYDVLQKEVLNLRKSCNLKDSSLNSKDDEIKMLMKKIDTLTKALEAESKKPKRDPTTREKEKDSKPVKADEKIRSPNSLKRPVNGSWRYGAE